MSKKLFIISGMLVLALALIFGSALATPSGTTKTSTPTTKAPTPVANVFAVCGCGKVFTPDNTTMYLTYEGKKYACCTKACHEYASKDPASCAKMSNEKVAQAVEKLSPKTATTTTEAAPK